MGLPGHETPPAPSQIYENLAKTTQIHMGLAETMGLAGFEKPAAPSQTYENLKKNQKYKPKTETSRSFSTCGSKPPKLRRSKCTYFVFVLIFFTLLLGSLISGGLSIYFQGSRFYEFFSFLIFAIFFSEFPTSRLSLKFKSAASIYTV